MSSGSFDYKTTSLGTLESKSGSINLDEAQGIVECFVAGIGNKDSVGDIVTTGAFTKSLMRRKPRVVWGHNWNDPIGKVLEIYEVPPTDRRLPMKMKMAGIGGLFARVQFNLQSEKGREAFANIAFFGEEQEWSIGYKTLRAQYDQKSQANVIYELELYEVSPVLHGANQLTGTISVKSEESSVAMMMPMDDQMGEGEIDKEELQKQLSAMLGTKVSVMDVSDDEVTFARQSNGEIKKYKCHFGRNRGQFMFGPPKPLIIIAKPTSMPMGSPGMPISMPSGMPENEPRRMVRPSQMPSMPVAIKPGENGIAMVPLPPVEYEDSQSPKFDPTNLDEEEADLRDALLKIVKRHGRFNEDEDGVWAGYKPAYKNPVAAIGVKCANCVFYQGEGKCKIIAMDVEPEGKCRFAVIPKGVVSGDVIAKKTAEFSADIDEENYLNDLQVKYPGELLVAAVRGAIGRKRRKRRKYKDLSEFGIESQDVEEKAYCLPVWPQHAFEVKQLLDPIFDYYMAETMVEPDGIVIKSGVSYEMIEAIDNALDGLKKKSLNDDDVEIKAVGYRLGRAIGSRLIDKPNIGGGRSARRFFTSRGAENFDPFTARDRNLNGIVGEGLFLRGQPLAQPDPTPDGPGSVRNPNPSPAQIDKPEASEVVDAAEVVKDKPKKAKKPKRKRRGDDIDFADITEEDLANEDKREFRRIQREMRKLTPAERGRISTRGQGEMGRQEEFSDLRASAIARDEDSRRDRLSSGSAEYQKYLNKPMNKRSEKERLKYDGPLNAFKDEERLSSGKTKDSDNVTPEEQKQVLDDIYAKMTQQFLEALEEIEKDPTAKGWKAPWRMIQHFARNATKSNRAYQGTNQLILTSVSQNRGYKSNKWAGAAQWKALGGKLSKDSRENKGVQILAPNNQATPIIDSKGNVVGSYVGFHTTEVWNVAEVAGLPEEMYSADGENEVMNLSPEQKIQDLEEVIKEIGPDWQEKRGNRAFYSRNTDSITMPEFGQFNSPVEFYGTLFHETVHWSGSPTRLNRKKGKQFGDEDYAFEELIAEIGSALALGVMGIDAPVREDHAPYVASWIKALKSRPDALKDAIMQAQQAVDYLMNRSATMRRKSGVPDEERKGKEDAILEVPMIVGFEDSPRIPTSGGIKGTFGDDDIDEIEPSLPVKKTRARKPKSESTKKPTKNTASKNRFASGTTRSSGQNTADENIFAGEYVRRTGKDGLSIDVAGRLSSGADRGLIPHKSGDEGKAIKRSPGTAHYGSIYGLSYEPTEQQKDIIDTVLELISGKTEPGVVSVVAGAGSGKTTTLKAAMAAAEREFDISRFAGKPEALKEKLDFISAKYSTPEDTFDLASMTPELRDSKLAEIRQKFKQGNAYYVVFNKKNQQEAEAEFTDNTGVATINSLTWWSLRLGQGDEKYGPKFKDKLQIAMKDQGPRQRPKAGKPIVPVTYTKLDGTVVTDDFGRTPGWRELGYVTLDETGGWVEALKLKERPEFNVDTKTGTVPGMPTDVGGVVIDKAETYAEILKKALNSWSISGDEKIGPQHFKRAEIIKQSKKAGRSTSVVDTDWPSVPEQWVKDAQAGVDMMMDPDSIVLPGQGHTDKLWALTDPDLRTDPGLVGHSLGKDVEDKVQIERGKYQVGDALPDGSIILKIYDSGQQGSKNVQAKIAKPYATKDNPLSMFMIDEAQDMNPVMEGVLAKNRERIPIVLVGDPNQAVYAFRGAKDILTSIGPDYDLTLNESFRFGPVIAWLANLALAQTNEDNKQVGINEKFHHVVGLATQVVETDFNLEGLSPEKLRDALAKIETKYKKDRIRIAQEGVVEDFKIPKDESISQVRERLKNLDKKYKIRPSLHSMTDEEIQKGIKLMQRRTQELIKIADADVPFSQMPENERDGAISALRDRLITESRGEIVKDMTDADAVLVSNNSTIMIEAAQFMRDWTPRYARNGKELPPVIMIPKTKHREMKAFFKHLTFIMDLKPEEQAKRTQEGNKPPISKLIGNVWNMQALQSKINQDQYSQLTTLYNLVRFGKPSEGLPARPAWEYVNMLMDEVLPAGTPGAPSAQIIPERTMLKLGKVKDVTAEALKTIASGTDVGRNITGKSRGLRTEIIPDTSGKGTTKVQWQLELADVNGEAKGEWTGGVQVFGTGLGGGGEFTSKLDGRTKTAPMGAYFRDISRILEEADYYGGAVTFKPGSIKRKEGAEKGTEDSFLIKADTEEQTAFILSDIVSKLRESAAGTEADIEITTIQLSKGREWPNVRMSNDFDDPEMLIEVINDDGSISYRKNVSRTERLNVLYVGLSRAMRRIDPGSTIFDLFLDPTNPGGDRGLKAIEEAIKDGRLPENMGKPSDMYNPYEDDGRLSSGATASPAAATSTGTARRASMPASGGRMRTLNIVSPEDEDNAEDDSDTFDIDDETNMLFSELENIGLTQEIDSDSGRLSSGETSARAARRVSGTRRVRSSRDAEKANPRIIAGIRLMGDPGESREYAKALDFSMKIWDGFRRTGIALDVDTQTASSENRQKEIRSAMGRVSKRIGSKPNITVGNVSENAQNQSPTASTWMLSVDKLRDTIRIPTEFSVVDTETEEGNKKADVRWTQSRPISNEEIASLLSLDKQNAEKLNQPGAAISHDSVRILIGEVGREPAFSGWELFAPLNRKTPGVMEMTPEERISEASGRANMRDRFIIETFGKDAFPFWFDPEENQVIDSDEYDALGEVSAASKFRAVGQFDRRDALTGDSEVEVDFYSEGLDTVELNTIDPEVTEQELSADKTSRSDFKIDNLLEYLGISRQDWVDRMTERMRESFGVEDVGLVGRDAVNSWLQSGVPVAYISEMVRTGLIPDASSVWGDSGPGGRLDRELSRKKPIVYEALFDFMKKTNPDKKITRNIRDSVGGSNAETTVRKTATAKGIKFSPGKGDEPRFSDAEIEAIVKRFNDTFDTNYGVDDIFSAEQLNAAKNRLEQGETVVTKKKEPK